jgi:pyridoxamine 5'-phosphate oxidase
LSPRIPEKIDPMGEVARQFVRAAAGAPSDPTAANLATAGADGRPASRMVLVKRIDPEGFPFFTNYESRKGRQLAESPWAALCFHWPWIELQVRAEGRVERLPEADSEAYFRSRPRGHQLGAWASRQSEPMRSRVTLLRAVVATQARFLIGEIPRPPHWGGYRLVPDRIELWQGRPDRLHDRFLFTLENGEWTRTRLFP